jgi:hypothetical protein
MKKFLPLLIVMAFASCKKGNDTKDLLTRSWQIIAITVKRSGGIATPMDISLCSQNRIWSFQKDGSFANVPSPNCTPDGLDYTLNGNWNLIDNKTLKIESQGGIAAMYLEAQIITITKSRLVLRRSNNSGGGGGFLEEVETTFEFVGR